jgi:hypothetical protein
VFSGEHRSEDLALLYLGAPEFGSASSSNEEEPHFILRRAFSGSEVVVAIRIDWEGVFTVLANDEEYAERLFRELIQPCSPDEVNRGWSDDSETLAMYQQLLALA